MQQISDDPILFDELNEIIYHVFLIILSFIFTPEIFFYQKPTISQTAFSRLHHLHLQRIPLFTRGVQSIMATKLIHGKVCGLILINQNKAIHKDTNWAFK
jgi:hypothetical protein